MSEKKEMQANRGGEILCASCGGAFEDKLPQCPYCGTLNLKGAEAEYMGKLEGVRADMEKLKDVTGTEAKKELHRLGKLVCIILTTLAGIALLMVLWVWWENRGEEHDAHAEYLWKQQNYPILDELYEQQKYDELLEFYRSHTDAYLLISDWEHSEFCRVLDDLDYLEKIFLEVQSGEEMSDGGYSDMLYYGWRFRNGKNTWFLTESEKQLLAPAIEEMLADFEEYWKFNEEELAAFEKEMAENEGYVSYEFCLKYVKKRRGGN